MALQVFEQHEDQGDYHLEDDAHVCLVLVVYLPDAYLNLMLLIQVVAELLHLRDLWQSLYEGGQRPEAQSRPPHCCPVLLTIQVQPL